MPRKLVIMITVMLVASIIVIGCSNNSNTQGEANNQNEEGNIHGDSDGMNQSNDSSEEADVEPINATSISGNTGGNVHVITGALGAIIEEHVPGSNITVNPGESGSNPILLGNGEAEIGTTLYFNAVKSANGEEPYNEPVENVAALANLNISQWIAFVTTRTEYSTLKDMIEDEYPMDLVLASAGSTSETLIRLILEGYGVTYQDIESWGGSVTHVSHSEAVNLVRDNHADVYATIPSERFPALVDLTTSRDVSFLTLDSEIIDMVAEEHQLLTGTLPAQTYDGQDEEYYSLMETQILLANENGLTDEAAYTIVKLLAENIDQLRNAHSDMNSFDLEIAPTKTVFPLHPGAKRYYEEVGVLE